MSDAQHIDEGPEPLEDVVKILAPADVQTQIQSRHARVSRRGVRRCDIDAALSDHGRDMREQTHAIDRDDLDLVLEDGILGVA